MLSSSSVADLSSIVVGGRLGIVCLVIQLAKLLEKESPTNLFIALRCL